MRKHRWFATHCAQVPVAFIPCDGPETRTSAASEDAAGFSFYNEAQCEVVLSVVQQLLRAGLTQADIGVVTPYNGQVSGVASYGVLSRVMSKATWCAQVICGAGDVQRCLENRRHAFKTDLQVDVAHNSRARHYKHALSTRCTVLCAGKVHRAARAPASHLIA